MAGKLMEAALLLNLQKGFLVVLVLHVNTWEEDLHQELGVVLTVELMVTGQETARLVTGRTNATAVVKGAILKGIARTVQGISGVREAIHGLHPHAVDGAAAGATAEAVAIANPDPQLDLPGVDAVNVTRGDQGVLAIAGAQAPGVLCHLQRKRSAAAHLMAAGAQGAPAQGVM